MLKKYKKIRNSSTTDTNRILLYNTYISSIVFFFPKSFRGFFIEIRENNNALDITFGNVPFKLMY